MCVGQVEKRALETISLGGIFLPGITSGSLVMVLKKK